MCLFLFQLQTIQNAAAQLLTMPYIQSPNPYTKISPMAPCGVKMEDKI